MTQRRLIRSMLLGLGLVLSLLTPLSSGAEAVLRIGVTLHSYYSWLSNVVQDQARVIPILPETSDPHLYQPRPEDLERLTTLDALVVNGLGHDEFVVPMLEAIGDKAPELIEPNDRVPLVAARGADTGRADGGTAVNSHTFLSITGAVHQVAVLASAMQRLDPDRADVYQQHARAYKRRLRRLLADALAQLKTLRIVHLRIGTVHDGYAYLFQELGLSVHAVVQPRHGIQPSPRQLADSIARIRAAGINLLFAEMDYEQQFVDIVQEETGTRIARLSHISRGPYAAEHFERQMAANLRAILAAIRTSQ